MPNPKPNRHSFRDGEIVHPMTVERLTSPPVGVFIIVSGLVGLGGTWVTHKTASNNVRATYRGVVNPQNDGPSVNPVGWDLEFCQALKPYIGPLFRRDHLFIGVGVCLVEDARHRRRACRGLRYSLGLVRP